MSNSYMASTKKMAMGTTAANSCVFALSNPTGSGRNIRLKRLAAKLGFAGTAAASMVDYGVTRATGTAAAGSGNASGASIAKRVPGVPDSVALLRWGPTAITGLTADAPGDFKTTFANNQNGTPYWDELVADAQRQEETDVIVIAPGTSLAVFSRTISVAGNSLVLDIEWDEVPA